MAKLPTSQSNLPSAEICRVNQWGPGTVLEREVRPEDSLRKPVRAEITAIGRRQVLAMVLEYDDDLRVEKPGAEFMINLQVRNWRAVG